VDHGILGGDIGYRSRQRCDIGTKVQFSRVYTAEYGDCVVAEA
jgi:hypothetical protein